jgi:flagellar protein FliS
MKFTQSEVAGLYTQGNAHGASPLGLIVALYDTILRDLSRAGEAIEKRDIEKRTFELNHALRVIAELENVLDFERGGEAAKRLKNFYLVTRGMILDASVKNSREATSQLWDIFATVRKAWREAEQKMKNSAGSAMQVPPRDDDQSHPMPVHAARQHATATPSGADYAEAATRGNWRA